MERLFLSGGNDPAQNFRPKSQTVLEAEVLSIGLNGYYIMEIGELFRLKLMNCS
jgi:hypothetical protein